MVKITIPSLLLSTHCLTKEVRDIKISTPARVLKKVSMRQLTKPGSVPPITKRPHRISVHMLALLLGCIGWLVSVAACSATAFSVQAPPMIPMAYYQCMEATPKDLADSYFSPYGNRWLAEFLYTDQKFVFKNIKVDKQMLQTKGSNYIWVDNTIKCVAISADAVSKLKVGQSIDIVGVMRGIPKEAETQYSLLMTDCYLLPAGSLALPLSGGATFSVGY